VQKAEFRQMLLDLDGLEGIPERSVDAYVEQEFAAADLNHDELVSIDELYLYYYAVLCFKFPVGRDGVNPGELRHGRSSIQSTTPQRPSLGARHIFHAN
jgi:hypothetical protein